MAVADDYLTPEARARRENIDRLLREAGWTVQRFRQMEIGAARGVAVREFPTPTGPVDYLLFVDAQGARDDRGEEGGRARCLGVESQTERYTEGFAQLAEEQADPLLGAAAAVPLQSTGAETLFTNLPRPDRRGRATSSHFHRPETLLEWAQAGVSLRDAPASDAAARPDGPARGPDRGDRRAWSSRSRERQAARR